MATLFITVWDSAKEVALGAPLQEEVVAIGAGSLQSNVITTQSDGRVTHRRVRLYADADCFVTWGSDPTALNDGSAGRAMGADNPEYFEITAGEKIAVIERV